MTLSEYVHNYRVEHKLSLREMGRRAEMSATHLMHIERGFNNDGKPISPSIDSYVKIAKATGRNLADLLVELDDMVKINEEISDSDRALISLYHNAPPAIREAVRSILLPYDDVKGLDDVPEK